MLGASQWSQIGDNGVKYLGALLQQNSRLRKLVMKNCNISDNGAAILSSALQNNSSLHELDLSRNKIHDMGIRSICELVRFPHFMSF